MKIDKDLAQRLVEALFENLGRVEWPATKYCEVKIDVPDHSKD